MTQDSIAKKWGVRTTCFTRKTVLSDNPGCCIFETEFLQIGKPTKTGTTCKRKAKCKTVLNPKQHLLLESFHVLHHLAKARLKQVTMPWMEEILHRCWRILVDMKHCKYWDPKGTK